MSLNCGHQRAYCSSNKRYMGVEIYGGMILTGQNRITWRKTCPSATLSITNLTWTDTGANPGLRCQRSATGCIATNDFLLYFVRFHVLTVASKKVTTCWDVAPCSLVEVMDVSEVRTSSIIA
jgi:hypothetical protein